MAVFIEDSITKPLSRMPDRRKSFLCHILCHAYKLTICMNMPATSTTPTKGMDLTVVAISKRFSVEKSRKMPFFHERGLVESPSISMLP